MAILKFLASAPHLHFLRYRTVAYAFSAALLAITLVSLAVQGLNFGIDFKGGILVEVRSKEGPADIGGLRSQLGGIGLGEVSIQTFGQPSDALIRVQRQEGGEGAQQAAIAKIRDTLGDSVTYRRVEFVGPQVGEELVQDGVMAVVLAMLAIMAYIWFRFEWQFGAAGVLTLVHDVIVTIGFLSVLNLEFSLATVAAVLTIAGYSINDTVVVYDRIRENLRKYKKLDLDSLCDLSLNEILTRTVLTSLTTVIALLALFIFGGPVIREFCATLIFGVLIGTYSSIFVATPLLLRLNLQRAREAANAAEEEAV